MKRTRRMPGRLLTAVTIGSATVLVGCAAAGGPSNGEAHQSTSSGASIKDGAAGSMLVGDSIGDPCSLLATAEITEAVGVEMGQGRPHPIDETSADCVWETVDPTRTVTLTLNVSWLDPDMWDSYMEMGSEEDPTVVVAGSDGRIIRIGGVILGGTFVVKSDERMATFYIAAPYLDDQQTRSASETLTGLIAGRL